MYAYRYIWNFPNWIQIRNYLQRSIGTPFRIRIDNTAANKTDRSYPANILYLITSRRVNNGYYCAVPPKQNSVIPLSPALKGILQRILRGVETRFIRSMLINWRSASFLKLN
jgi:hypothetical protein